MGIVAWRRCLRNAVSCRSYGSFARACGTAAAWSEDEGWLIAVGHCLEDVRITYTIGLNNMSRPTVVWINVELFPSLEDISEGPDAVRQIA